MRCECDRKMNTAAREGDVRFRDFHGSGLSTADGKREAVMFGGCVDRRDSGGGHYVCGVINSNFSEDLQRGNIATFGKRRGSGHDAAECAVKINRRETR